MDQTENIQKTLFHNLPILIKISPIIPYSPNQLSPQEILYSKSFKNNRLNEFYTSRLLLKDLLQSYNIHNFPILSNENRSPLFPPGICGSISHTKKNCYVALASQKNVLNIGIDAELMNRLHPKLWKICLTPEEFLHINSLPSQDTKIFLATLIFSAKEAFYKYQFPLTNKFLGFLDATITNLPSTIQPYGSLQIKVLNPLHPIHQHTTLPQTIFYMILEDEILTAISTPANSAPQA